MLSSFRFRVSDKINTMNLTGHNELALGEQKGFQGPQHSGYQESYPTKRQQQSTSSKIWQSTFMVKEFFP